MGGQYIQRLNGRNNPGDMFGWLCMRTELPVKSKEGRYMKGLLIQHRKPQRQHISLVVCTLSVVDPGPSRMHPAIRPAYSIEGRSCSRVSPVQSILGYDELCFFLACHDDSPPDTRK